MKIVKKMRLVSCEQKSTEKGIFFICSFLDEEDDKFTFFVSEDFYNKVKNLKKYDTVDVNLNIYYTQKGRYGLSIG